MKKDGMVESNRACTLFILAVLVVVTLMPMPSLFRRGRGIPQHQSSAPPQPQPQTHSAQPSTHSKASIPRKVHLVWNSAEIGGAARAIDNKWRSMEPSLSRVVVTQPECRNLASRYNGLLPLYDAMPVNVMRADTCRVLAVYYYGGIYMDLDVDWVKPIDSFFQFNASIQVGNETADGHHICNWFFGASRRHPCLKRVLDEIIQRSSVLNTQEKEFVHKTTGRGAFTAGLRSCGAVASWSGDDMRTGHIHHLFGSKGWQKSGYSSWEMEQNAIQRQPPVLQPAAQQQARVREQTSGQTPFRKGHRWYPRSP